MSDSMLLLPHPAPISAFSQGKLYCTHLPNASCHTSYTFAHVPNQITSLRLIICLRMNNYTIVQHIRGVMIPAQPNFVAFPDTNSGPVKSRMVTNVDVSRCESDDPTSGFLAISHLESHQVNCGTITPLQQQVKWQMGQKCSWRSHVGNLSRNASASFKFRHKHVSKFLRPTLIRERVSPSLSLCTRVICFCPALL